MPPPPGSKSTAPPGYKGSNSTQSDGEVGREEFKHPPPPGFKGPPPPGFKRSQPSDSEDDDTASKKVKTGIFNACCPLCFRESEGH